MIRQWFLTFLCVTNLIENLRKVILSLLTIMHSHFCICFKYSWIYNRTSQHISLIWRLRSGQLLVMGVERCDWIKPSTYNNYKIWTNYYIQLFKGIGKKPNIRQKLEESVPLKPETVKCISKLSIICFP